MIKDIIAPPRVMGNPCQDDRRILSGIQWIIDLGAEWRDLTERYGPWKTVYQRFRQWRDDGICDRILTRLHLRLREGGTMDLDTWMVDSTSIRATRPASGAGKKGGLLEPLDHAFGHSSGRLNTKIHSLCDNPCFPLVLSLSAGQRADSIYAVAGPITGAFAAGFATSVRLT